MTGFTSSDLVPLWDRPPAFLPREPPSGAYRWRSETIRSELAEIANVLDKASAERRVALLANPAFPEVTATDGLHVGVQMLQPGEHVEPHRHSPAALRIGLEGHDVVTQVNDEEYLLDPLDVVLNPSGTWHGHVERGGSHALWLDVVDLPLVSGLGGVHFEPSLAQQRGSLLDPSSIPNQVRFPWADTAVLLDGLESEVGVRMVSYGGGEVLPTLAVTAYAVEAGATLRLPVRTAGAVVLVGQGEFSTTLGVCQQFDVVALRSWTPFELTANGAGIVIVTDTSPALRRLELYREVM